MNQNNNKVTYNEQAQDKEFKVKDILELMKDKRLC